MTVTMIINWRWIPLTDYIDYSIIVFFAFSDVCYNCSWHSVRMSYWNKKGYLLTYLHCTYLLTYLLRDYQVTALNSTSPLRLNKPATLHCRHGSGHVICSEVDESHYLMSVRQFSAICLVHRMRRGIVAWPLALLPKLVAVLRIRTVGALKS